MSTRQLAKQLGLVEVIHVGQKPNTCTALDFEFLTILDFEATCWDRNDSSKGLNEIIEFSVVLYDVKHMKILSEFQQYVKPTEAPKLSEFCIGLTGIKQDQVDKGVVLEECIILFNRWLREQSLRYNFHNNEKIQNETEKTCAFVTWSDWDLKTCLPQECKRKFITKPTVLNRWIDLRALFKEHYGRIPNGLNGALSEVGLSFAGTQHCALHDARNTAFLAGKMISEGVLLRITKNITPRYI